MPDGDYPTMTIKHIMTAATLIALVAPAIAADKLSMAGVPAGTYCQVIEPDIAEGWMNFTLGKCTPDTEVATLTLKTNGDFVLGGIGDETECKVNPKSYFKGWADYNCKTYGGRVMRSKRNLKFTTHGAGTLGLAGLN
jgi:hypothetical protein